MNDIIIEHKYDERFHVTIFKPTDAEPTYPIVIEDMARGAEYSMRAVTLANALVLVSQKIGAIKQTPANEKDTAQAKRVRQHFTGRIEALNEALVWAGLMLDNNDPNVAKYKQFLADKFIDCQRRAQAAATQLPDRGPDID